MHGNDRIILSMNHHSILKFRYFLKDYCLFFSTAAVVFFFFLSRYPFFAFTPIAEVTTEDSVEYYGMVLDFISGKNKIDFGYLSPGYPFFLFIIGILKNTTIAVILAQNLVALLAGIFLIYSIYSCYGSYAYLISFTLCGYFSSELNIDVDSLILPDSIYTSLLIFYCSFLILALEKNKVIYWIFLSLISAELILIRSSALFIFPVMFCIVFFMVYNKYKRSSVLAFIVPFSIIMVIYSAYNYYSINTFTIVTNKRGYHIQTISTPITEDEQKMVNEFISFLPKDNLLKTANDSWDFVAVHNSYCRIRWGTELYFDSLDNLILQHKFDEKIYVDRIVNYKSASYITYKQKLKEKIGYTKYELNLGANLAKFTLVNFAAYFNSFRRTDYDFYGYKYGWRYYFYLVNQTQQKPFIYYPMISPVEGTLIKDSLRFIAFKELINSNLKSETDFQNLKTSRNSTLLYKLYDSFNRIIRDVLFNNYFWIFVFIIGFIYSIIINIQFRFNNIAIFLLFIFCCLHISSALLFSTRVVLPRYSFTTEFIYYLSAVFLIICFLNKKEISKN